MQLANQTALESAMMAEPASTLQPALVIHPHALTGDGRTMETAAFLAKETLAAYVERTKAIVPTGPVVVWHNGYRVPDALWRQLIPRTGDQVIIRARVLGGGGNNKVLTTVAFIALTIATYGAGSWAGLGASLANGTGLSLAAAQGLMMIGGSLMIAPLYPEVTA